MKIKKLISLLAATAMAVTALTGAMSVSADTATGDCGENVHWSFNESTGVLTITGEGPMYQDDYVGNTSWTYSNYSNQVKKVVFEDGVTDIGSCAFGKAFSSQNMYPNLTKITLPTTIKKIGNFAFASLNIEEISLPDSLIEIGECAFNYSKITSIILHEGMTIGGCAFQGCESLKEVIIGKNITFNLTMIGVMGMGRANSAFSYCTGLEKVTIEDGVTDLNVENLFGNCKSLNDIYLYSADLKSVVTGGNDIDTFPNNDNLIYHIYKDSTTEQTLKDAGYLNDENTVYLADTTALETTITEAEAVETDKYTDETVSALTKAIENAKTVLENIDATQDEVDSAVKAIEDAKNALVEKPDEPSTDNSSDPSNSSDNNNQSQSPNTPATPPTAAPTTATPKVTTPVVTTVAKPAKVKNVKVTAKKKKLNVSWKKVSGATGYEVKYAKNNKFTKGKKTVTVKQNKVTLKKLKPKKKYFVKVRAYKLANGRKYFGKWSKVVKKKTK